MLAFTDSQSLIESVAQALESKVSIDRSLFVERQAKDYARGLYGNLRHLDEVGVASCIVVEEPPGDSAWHGVRVRLRRAGHGSNLHSLFMSA